MSPTPPARCSSTSTPGAWDDELCSLSVPRAILPEVKDSAANFGETASEPVRRQRFPFAGIAGDQQAAIFGQACFEPGMIKSTYGTGCFALLNTGNTPVMSQNMLYHHRLSVERQATYALEGSIFVAGAAVQWLRDGLGIIGQAAETGPLAANPIHARRLFGSRIRRPWRALLESARARRVVRPHPQHGPAELAHAALESVAFRPTIFARRCAPTGRAKRPPTCSASTAA